MPGDDDHHDQCDRADKDEWEDGRGLHAASLGLYGCLWDGLLSGTGFQPVFPILKRRAGSPSHMETMTGWKPIPLKLRPAEPEAFEPFGQGRHREPDDSCPVAVKLDRPARV